MNAPVIQLRPDLRQTSNVKHREDAEGAAEVVPDDDAKSGGRQPELGGDARAVPELERLPLSPEGRDSGASIPGSSAALEAHAARHRSLELVSAAVELADRIERHAHDAVAERIGKADEEVRRRKREIEQHELELERRRQEVEHLQQQAAEAARAAQSLVARAEQEAAEKLEQAGREANALLEQARAEAEELKRSKTTELEQALEQARAAHSGDDERQLKPVDDDSGEDPSRLSFAPPPLSAEDVAAGGTLPRFGRTL